MGFSGLVHALTHFAQHLSGTDWGEKWRPSAEESELSCEGPGEKGKPGVKLEGRAVLAGRSRREQEVVGNTRTSMYV